MKNATIRLSGRLICASRHEADIVMRCLPEHLRLTREEPGCVYFSVSQTAQPLIWRVDELFTDRAAFEFHQHRTRASTWGKQTAHIAREYEIIGLA